MFQRDVYGEVMFNAGVEDRRADRRVRDQTDFLRRFDDTKLARLFQKAFPAAEVEPLTARIMSSKVRFGSSAEKTGREVEAARKAGRALFVRYMPAGKRGVCWIKQHYGRVHTLFGTLRNGRYTFQAIDLPLDPEAGKMLANGPHGTVLYGCLHSGSGVAGAGGAQTLVIEHVCLFQSQGLLGKYDVAANMRWQHYLLEFYARPARRGEVRLAMALTVKVEGGVGKAGAAVDSERRAAALPYPVHSTQLWRPNALVQEHVSARKSIAVGDVLESGRRRTLLVQPLPGQDHYRALDPETREPQGAILVQTFAQSARLNSLFRRVRENADLDAREESDDEEDARLRPLGFVTGGERLLECVYHKWFEGWMVAE
jgi:hypothetical protein